MVKAPFTVLFKHMNKAVRDRGVFGLAEISDDLADAFMERDLHGFEKGLDALIQDSGPTGDRARAQLLRCLAAIDRLGDAVKNTQPDDFPLDCMRLALERGWNADGVDNEPYSPLWYAQRRQDLAMIMLLLDHGADPNNPNAIRCPLHAALRDFHVAAVDLLLQRGADPNRYSDEDPI